MTPSILFLVLTILASSTEYGATSRGDGFLGTSLAAVKRERWMVRFGRVYADESEKAKRFEIFKKKLEFVESFNRNGNATYKLGINQFSDLTDEEFRATLTPAPINRVSRPRSYWTSTAFRYANVTDAPQSIDWRDKGAVTHVKNQKKCGACWAFAAVAAVEGITQITTGNLVALSEQRIIDCEAKNIGCERGGTPVDAYKYMTRGIASERDYPYRAAKKPCKPNVPNVASITDYDTVYVNNEEELKKAVSRQPVSVPIDSAFRDYRGGVYDGPCGTSMDHAVAIVGYGETEDGTKYWLVKNSWGGKWGERGFMRIRRDVGVPEGKCGLAMFPSFPVVQ